MRSSYIAFWSQALIKDVEELSEIALEEPQLALAAYTKGLCKRWTFVQRTIPDISELFLPLEHTIATKLIPSITGRHVSRLERDLLSLPIRYGGIGIQDPSKTAQLEFESSVRVTAQLTDLIYNQESTLEKLDQKK